MDGRSVGSLDFYGMNEEEEEEERKTGIEHGRWNKIKKKKITNGRERRETREKENGREKQTSHHFIFFPSLPPSLSPSFLSSFSHFYIKRLNFRVCTRPR